MKEADSETQIGQRRAEAVTFTALRIEDKDLYQEYYRRSSSLISDLCFNSRMAWAKGFDYHKAVVEDSLVLSAQSSLFTGLHFSMPLGLRDDEHFFRIVEKLWSPYAALNAAMADLDGGERYPFLREGEKTRPFLRFLFCCEEKASALAESPYLGDYEIEIFQKRDFADYLYDREALAGLVGKKLRTRRNHWNQFLHVHPDFVFRRFSEADIPAALRLCREWCEEKGLPTDDLTRSDYLAICSYLEHFSHLDHLGAVLYSGDERELLAFCLGSETDEMNVTHFEKARENVVGAYAAINKLTAERLYTKPLVNREEDMGEEGIRRVKEAYRPLRLIPKYEVLLRQKRGRSGETCAIENASPRRGESNRQF